MFELELVVSLEELYSKASKDLIKETVSCIQDWEDDNKICILDFMIGEGDIPDHLHSKVTPQLVMEVNSYDPWSRRPYAYLEYSIKAIELFMENDSMNSNMGDNTGRYHCWCQKFLLYKKKKSVYRLVPKFADAKK